MKRSVSLNCAIIASLAISLSSYVHAVDSALWNQFKSAKSTGAEPTLPDYSYAGYDYSENPIPDTSNWPTFDVRDYGARPNDNDFDDAGIQAAIEAAENNGRGVVFFPAGQFKVSPDNDPKRIIKIQGSNIVLKGSGSGSNGTIIFMDKMKIRGDMFQVTPKNLGRTVITKVTRDAKRETFSIDVADASNLRVGQRIVLRMTSIDFANRYYAPLKIHSTWTRLLDEGFRMKEIHSIAAINGKRITLREPLHISFKASDEVTVTSVPMLENVGIEHIRFKGNWNSHPEEFKHHKNDIHNYAWNALTIHRVQNGWIRNCEFKDWNQSIQVRESAAFTISQTILSGKRGHLGIHARASYGVLIKDSKDLAGHHHGPSLGDFGTNTVYQRYQMTPDQRMDSHSGSPYATLFDNMKGGNFWGNGGPLKNFPHHGRYFVAWNFNVNGGPDSYDFWPAETGRHNPNVFAMPFFSGLHGKSIQLKNGTFSSNESPGKKVYPTSLFDAQHGLRMLPDFTYCCESGNSKTFDTPVDVAYGAEGRYNYKYGVTGKVTFNDATFGDPVKGVRKSGFYRPSAGGPAGYSFATNEGGTVRVSGPTDIAYGANGRFNYRRNQNSDVVCTNATFGDPIKGVRKACYTKAATGSSASSSSSSSSSNSSSSSSSGASSACQGTANVARNVKAEIDLNATDCVNFATSLAGETLQVWDSDTNDSCNFRGSVTSQDGSGNLNVTGNYVSSSSFTGRTLKFSPNNGCKFVKVRYY